MTILLSLSTFALRQVVDGVCSFVGASPSGEAVIGFLVDRFTDHSKRLTDALKDANGRAWKALEIALAGDSFWERCKQRVASAEDRAFSQKVRAFLDATPLPELAGKNRFRQVVLAELRAARKAGLLTGGDLEPGELARHAGAFARFSDPESILNAEREAASEMADLVRQAGHPNLAWFLSQRPAQGYPVHIAGVRYFFRRAVEEDARLFQGLAFARLETIKDGQDTAFTQLHEALARQGEHLEEMLGDVKVIVVETHSAVLDLQTQLRGQGEQIAQIGEAILKLLEQRELQRRELRPADSMSYRNEEERQLVKQATARYRALPEAERRRLPALLHAVGKLEVVAGDFEQARQDFEVVATLTDNGRARAEAHFNAYRAALERAGETRAKEDWDKALAELVKAVNLDARRFLPFPAGKYRPRRILGAGGFGVVFLCKHREMNDLVVVKTLVREEMERDADKSFAEARVLRQLDHPAIIRTLDAGYMDSKAKSRPYIVMDYFDGLSLDEYVRVKGPLLAEDLGAVAKQAAEGLLAAHGKRIWHRDVKPANILVRREQGGWRVKIIDFGLALCKKGAASASTSRSKTLMGASVAGTLDYAAPEQLGMLSGVGIGPYSDVYGFGKTCSYALFQTTQPRSRHFQDVPRPLADLLEACMEEQPKMRPADFGQVLERLAAAKGLGGDLKVLKEGPTALPPAKALWYYMHNGQQIGPVNMAELRVLLAAGHVSRTDVVWRIGLPNWVVAEEVPELLPSLRPVSPPVPKVVPAPVKVVQPLQPQAGVPRGASDSATADWWRQPDLPPDAGPPHKGSVRKATRGVRKANIRFFMPARTELKDLFSFPYSFKVYLDGNFMTEAPHKVGFDLQWEVEQGDHVLEVVMWCGGDKDRKRFDLCLDRPGDYVIRFNYAWFKDMSLNGIFGQGQRDHMQNSTIDVLRRPE